MVIRQQRLPIQNYIISFNKKSLDKLNYRDFLNIGFLCFTNRMQKLHAGL